MSGFVPDVDSTVFCQVYYNIKLGDWHHSLKSPNQMQSDLKICSFLIRSGMLSPSKKYIVSSEMLFFWFFPKIRSWNWLCVCTFTSWSLCTKCKRCSITSAVCYSASFSLLWSDLRSSCLKNKVRDFAKTSSRMLVPLWKRRVFVSESGTQAGYECGPSHLELPSASMKQTPQCKYCTWIGFVYMWRNEVYMRMTVNTLLFCLEIYEPVVGHWKLKQINTTHLQWKNTFVHLCLKKGKMFVLTYLNMCRWKFSLI